MIKVIAPTNTETTPRANPVRIQGLDCAPNKAPTNQKLPISVNMIKPTAAIRAGDDRSQSGLCIKHSIPGSDICGATELHVSR